MLQQPAMSEILHYIQNTAKYTQNIQRNVTIIKSSVGLSITLLNTANFSGNKTTTVSWAQITAQAKGPPAPPPVTQNKHTTKTQLTITAYKDQIITVKLKDHSIIQRYRTHLATWIKHQVKTSIYNNVATKSIKIVVAYQLKSGNIQIFTSTTAETIQLKENKK